jgi:peroxiredoxin
MPCKACERRSTEGGGGLSYAAKRVAFAWLLSATALCSCRNSSDFMTACEKYFLLVIGIFGLATTTVDAKNLGAQGSPEKHPTIMTAGAKTLPRTQSEVAAAKRETSTFTAGDRRPGFKLKDWDGHYRDLNEWDGKLIFLNFWATWCPPCLHEIPVFNELQAQHADAGIQFLGIALDKPREVKRFIAEHGMNYPSLHRGQEAVDLLKLYRNKYGGLPYTVVMGRDGVVLHTHPGVLQREQAEALIRGAP